MVGSFDFNTISLIVHVFPPIESKPEIYKRIYQISVILVPLECVDFLSFQIQNLYDLVINFPRQYTCTLYQ